MSFDDEEHLKAWLIRTTINLSKKMWGSIWRKKVVSLDNLPEQVYQFDTEEQDYIYSALCEIPTKYRTVLHLFYFEDMSVEQISKALKIRPGTVRMQLTRGREMMREKLKGEYQITERQETI